MLVGLPHCGSWWRVSRLAVRRDSAGIEVVVSPAEDRLLGWRFTLRFTLGGAEEGPEQFYNVSTGIVDADAAGNMYILDGSSHVVVFDSTGRHMRTVGGPGRGPWRVEPVRHTRACSCARAESCRCVRGLSSAQLRSWARAAGSTSVQACVPFPPRRLSRNAASRKRFRAFVALLSPSGELWVERREVGRFASGPIDIFDASGAYEGTLPTGSPFPLIFVSDSRIGVRARTRWTLSGS